MYAMLSNGNELSMFLDCFEEIWMGKFHRKDKRAKVHGFSIEVWNRFDVAIEILSENK